MSKSESELTRHWCAKLEACGASVLPVVAGMRGKSGWPDRFIAYRDQDTGASGSVWLEFKLANGVVKPLQRMIILKLCQNGQRAYVARHFEGTVIQIENVYGELEAVCKTTKDLLQFISHSTPASEQQE